MNLTDIKKALDELKGENPDKVYTKKDIILEYIDDLLKLHSYGHSYDSIVKSLKTVDIDISVSTLRSYMSSLRKKRRKKKNSGDNFRVSQEMSSMKNRHNKIVALDNTHDIALPLAQTGSGDSDFSSEFSNDAVE